MPGSSIPKQLSQPEPSGLVVEVANRQRRRIVRTDLVRVVRHVLAQHGCSHGLISLAIVDSQTMRQLNRQYLNHDDATDVLSFLFSRQNRRKSLSGEIVVCADVAASVASDRSWSWQEELLLYAVHGALHLVGYNDQSIAQRRRMRAAEQKVLRELSIPVVPGALPPQRKKSQ